MVQFLDGHGLVSAYHLHYAESQGTETRNTFYMYRKAERCFHIDHCFIPKAWAPYLKSVQVGAYADWCHLSDHCPMVVELDFERKGGSLHQLH